LNLTQNQENARFFLQKSTFLLPEIAILLSRMMARLLSMVEWMINMRSFLIFIVVQLVSCFFASTLRSYAFHLFVSFPVDMKWKKLMSSNPPSDPNIPPPLASHGAVLLNGKDMFIFGGYIKTPSAAGRALNPSLYRLDLSTLTWTKMTEYKPPDAQLASGHSPEFSFTHPAPRADFASVVFENRMFIFGGTGQKQRLNDLWMYSPDSNQWKCLLVRGSVPSPRFVLCRLPSRHSSSVTKSLDPHPALSSL
jgi:hypothetical protein